MKKVLFPWGILFLFCLAGFVYALFNLDLIPIAVFGVAAFLLGKKTYAIYKTLPKAPAP